MLTEDEVREALRVCFDPELAVNVVDLGLIYRVSVERDADAPGVEARFFVRVALTMRAPDEEREAMLVGQVANRLLGMREVSRAQVDVVWEPAWTAERMSAAARRQLGLDRGVAGPELVQIRM